MKKRLMIIAIILVGTLLICNHASGKPCEWTEYVVQEGDTVCGIAISITPKGKDYRHAQNYILKTNNIENAIIYPGQVILVPVYE